MKTATHSFQKIKTPFPFFSKCLEPFVKAMYMESWNRFGNLAFCADFVHFKYGSKMAFPGPISTI